VARGKRVSKPGPGGFQFPSEMKSAGGKSSKRFRRLRVVAEPNIPDGVYPLVRDVYLESSHCPLMVDGSTLFDASGIGEYSNVTCEMMNCGLPVGVVADMIRFFESVNVLVMYDPPGNMRNQLNPKKNGQTSLFD
jgi:hypothetical protein